MPRTVGGKRRSEDQRTCLARARKYVGKAPTISRKSNKENPRKKAQAAVTALQLLQDLKQKLDNTQRKVRHLNQRIGTLKKGKAMAVIQEKKMKTRLALTERDLNAVAQQNLSLQEALNQSEKLCHDLEHQLSEGLKRHRSELEKYKKHLKRAQKVRDRLSQSKVMARSPRLSLVHKRTYTETARKMIRMLVQSGCARSKVGIVLEGLAKEMGMKSQKDSKVRVVS
jgi:chromosome segregation ATPase